MFESSFPELVLVAVIGLLVLGPQRLPKVAAEIGKWIGRARRTAGQLRRQLEREVELADLEERQPPPPPPPADPNTIATPPPSAAEAVPTSSEPAPAVAAAAPERPGVEPTDPPQA